MLPQALFVHLLMLTFAVTAVSIPMLADREVADVLHSVERLADDLRVADSEALVADRARLAGILDLDEPVLVVVHVAALHGVLALALQIDALRVVAPRRRLLLVVVELPAPPVVRALVYVGLGSLADDVVQLLPKVSYRE